MQKPKARENILSLEEINRLKNACKNNKEKLVILGTIFTGERVSEFIHMKRSWIDKQGEIIKIPNNQKCSCYSCKNEIYEKIRDKKTKKVIGKKLVKPSGVWRVKTPAAERIIPIVPELKPLLLSYFKNHNSIMDIIPNRIRAWKIIKDVSSRIKMDHSAFPHAMRGTFATILASKDFDALKIRNIMGWQKIAVAEDYVKFNKEGVMRLFKDKW